MNGGKTSCNAFGYFVQIENSYSKDMFLYRESHHNLHMMDQQQDMPHLASTEQKKEEEDFPRLAGFNPPRIITTRRQDRIQIQPR